MWKTIKSKQEERAAMLAKSAEILKRSDDEKRQLTEEEKSEVEKIHEDAKTLLASIEMLKNQAEAESSQPADSQQDPNARSDEHVEDDNAQNLPTYLQHNVVTVGGWIGSHWQYFDWN